MQAGKTYVNFAEIRRRREAGGWTLAELGLRAGVPASRARQWWHDLENGRALDPAISQLCRAADALSCSVDAIVFTEPRGA